MGREDQNKTIIKGWRALEDLVGLKSHYIKRAMGLYGFPKPVWGFTPHADGSGRGTPARVWDRAAVEQWLVDARGDGRGGFYCSRPSDPVMTNTLPPET
jgi:hypothetical protein